MTANKVSVGRGRLHLTLSMEGDGRSPKIGAALNAAQIAEELIKG
jgi:hypothetical protein